MFIRTTNYERFTCPASRLVPVFVTLYPRYPSEPQFSDINIFFADRTDITNRCRNVDQIIPMVFIRRNLIFGLRIVLILNKSDLCFACQISSPRFSNALARTKNFILFASSIRPHPPHNIPHLPLHPFNQPTRPFDESLFCFDLSHNLNLFL